MNHDRDPALQSLFVDAGEDLSSKNFTARVMAQVDGQRRRMLIGWACIGLVLIALTALLAAALQDAVLLLMQSFNLSLVDLENRWLAQLLSPLNSVASLIAVGFIGLHRIYRKIFA